MFLLSYELLSITADSPRTCHNNITHVGLAGSAKLGEGKEKKKRGESLWWVLAFSVGVFGGDLGPKTQECFLFCLKIRILFLVSITGEEKKKGANLRLMMQNQCIVHGRDNQRIVTCAHLKASQGKCGNSLGTASCAISSKKSPPFPSRTGRNLLTPLVWG